jgi:uncharacterized protein DUF4160
VSRKVDERVHVNVHHPTGEAKIWLEPRIALAQNEGLSQRKLIDVVELVREHETESRTAWESMRAEGAGAAWPVAARRPFGPRFRLSPFFGVGAGAGLGDWFEDLDGGLAWDVGARIGVGERSYIGASFRRQPFEVDPSLERIEGVPIDWNVHMDEYLFLFGVTSRSTTATRRFAYLEGMFGGMFHSVHVTAQVNPPQQLHLEANKLGLGVGAGVVLPWTHASGFELGGSACLTGSWEDHIYGWLLSAQGRWVFFFGP